MQRSDLPAELDLVLPNGLRIAGYCASMTELAFMMAEKQSETQPLQDEGIADLFNNFKRTVVKMVEVSDVELEDFSLETCENSLQMVIDEYHDLKNILLRLSTQGVLHVRQFVALQDMISYMRRIAELSAKAARYLTGLTQFTELEKEGEPDEAP